MSLPDSALLGDAKNWLRDRLRDGARCPLCKQRAQIYRRPIGSAMALALIDARRRHGGAWFRMTDLLPRSGDTAKLVHWGLIEEEPHARPDGGRPGWWRVTDRGFAFIDGRLTVPRWALLYDARCLGYEGEPVTITDCLPKTFDLAALLAGAA